AALALIAWRNLPDGYYFADDFQILYEVANGNMVSLLFEPEWRHVNTTRNALLAIEYFLFGARPGAFYVVALALHCVNGFLLYRLSKRVTRQPAISAAVAAIWVLSPLHVGTLSWCAAHGHALIATTLFWMLGRVAALGEAVSAPSLRDALLWGLGMFVIATSYGVGLGIAMAFPLISIVIRGSWPSPSVRLVFAAEMAVLAAGYLTLQALYPVPHTRWTPTVLPALGTILSHPGAIALLGIEFSKVGVTALALGPMFRPDEMPSILIWLVPCGFVTLWIASLYRGTPSERRWLAGLVLLGLAGYAGVALGKGFQWAEDPTRGALEARYHYAPQAMWALATAVALSVLHRRAPRAVTSTAAACAVALAIVLIERPIEMRPHLHERQSTERALAEIHEAVSRTPPGETVYIVNRPFEGMAFLSQFQEKWAFPGIAGVFVVFFEHDEIGGRRVRFIAIEPEQMEATQRGGRISSLLVPRP
ncbi:MAG: hypothetical protein JRH17_24275, partial [Deltaproteobacteria bacterium]|nr:hypothetical protein [Deltaproteobacteria bacterium]